VLCLDLSDIRKEYAKKMEYLAPVHDGSTGEVHAGYWLCDVTGAEVNGSEIVPLYQKLYSAEAKEFLSENAEVFSRHRFGPDTHARPVASGQWIGVVIERNC